MGADCEDDPAPVASRVVLTARRSGCGIDVRVGARPNLGPIEPFPFRRVAVALRGPSGAARGYAKARRLAPDALELYRFGALRASRYRVSATYLR